ncbi:MAG: DUF6268 family outer membrane beta-barrel protein [Bacteroidota bacterium]
MKFRNCTLLYLIPLLFLVANAFGQKYVDIAKIYYGNTVQNNFENSDSSTRIKDLGFDITFPIVVNSSKAVLTGLIYERNETKLFEAGPVETFSVTGLRVGLSKKHSDKWSGTYLLVPKLASDFENITRKDFQIGAILLMKYTKREDLNYKLGLYYNSELFGPFIVPLFGLYYLSPDKKFEANLTLPFLADVNYKLHDRLNIGMNFFGQIRSYHLAEVETTGKGGYVVKATNDLYGYLKFNLSKGLSIYTRMGYSLGRSYRVYDEEDKITVGSVLIKIGDDRQQLNTDFANGLTFQFTMQYRFIQD